MDRVTVHGIDVFLTIVREGSMRAAAAKLGVGAPAVSLQLKSLEERLGVDLLVRTTRKLEMVTIDAAGALGLDDILGSVGVGKTADIVLVGMRQPHHYPPNMPVTRLAHFANAADADMVIVDGRVLRPNRRPRRVDAAGIPDVAAAETDRTRECAGLASRIEEPPVFCRAASRGAAADPVRD